MMRRYWCGGKKDFPKKAKIGDFEKENFIYILFDLKKYQHEETNRQILKIR